MIKSTRFRVILAAGFNQENPYNYTLHSNNINLRY